jgi:hypothetical protein
MQFHLTYNSGDESAAVLSGLQMYIADRQHVADELDRSDSNLAKHLLAVQDDLVTLNRPDILEGIKQPEQLLNEVMYWVAEIAEPREPGDFGERDPGRPQADIDAAVVALIAFRDHGAEKVEVRAEAAWVIEDMTEIATWIHSDAVEAAKNVLARAEAQLPPGACIHGKVHEHGPVAIP